MTPSTRIQVDPRAFHSSTSLRGATPFILLAFFLCFFVVAGFLIMCSLAIQQCWHRRRTIKFKTASLRAISLTSSPFQDATLSSQTLWSFSTRTTLVATGAVGLGIMPAPRTVVQFPGSRKRSLRGAMDKLVRAIGACSWVQKQLIPILPTSTPLTNEKTNELNVPAIIVTPPIDDGAFPPAPARGSRLRPFNRPRFMQPRVDASLLAPHGVYGFARIRSIGTSEQALEQEVVDLKEKDTLDNLRGAVEIRLEDMGLVSLGELEKY